MQIVQRKVVWKKQGEIQASQDWDSNTAVVFDTHILGGQCQFWETQYPLVLVAFWSPLPIDFVFS